MERELTKFQRNCEKRLTAALAAKGKRVSGRRLDGMSETYIAGKIEDRDILFWIYKDGADFKTGDLRPVFECCDYDSLEELTSAFVQQLIEAAA